MDIKSLLPAVGKGYWWEPRSNAGGVVIVLRWRLEGGKKDSETYPRISARMLRNLERKTDGQRKLILRGWVIAHNRKPETKPAARLGFETGRSD
jgi:hypothetical protein